MALSQQRNLLFLIGNIKLAVLNPWAESLKNTIRQLQLTTSGAGATFWVESLVLEPNLETGSCNQDKDEAPKLLTVSLGYSCRKEPLLKDPAMV